MHSLSNINEEYRTGMCSICGLVRVTLRDKHKKKLNSKYRCSTMHRKSLRKHNYPWRLHKKDKCEKCGFVPENPCQLDVDHIDGNSKNNAVENLQTLCANCHRLKTFLAQEGSYKFGLIKAPCPVDRAE